MMSRISQTDEVHRLNTSATQPAPSGNTQDLDGARALVAMVPCPLRLIADRAYDARSLRDWLAQRSVEAVIPPKSTRKHPHAYDANAYKSRNFSRPTRRKVDAIEAYSL